MSVSLAGRNLEWRRQGAAALVAAVTLAACGGSTEVPSASAPSTTETPATTSPATTAPPTTTPATTGPPPTTVPPTTMPQTTVPATTAPPTTAPATTAPPPTAPPASTPGTAFVVADEQLIEVDVATGATVRVLDESFSGIDGLFRGGLRLSPDRSTIWFSEGYEDGWYECESSIGSVGRVDAATGEVEVLGVGGNAEPSADGMLLAYTTSSLCLPDPEAPEFWVLTPGDRVVVRHLETGEEREFVTDTPPDGYGAPSEVRGGWFSPGGNLLVLLGDGSVVDVDVDGSGIIQDHPVVLNDVNDQPIAATADALITVDLGDEGSTDAYSTDAASGDRTLLASAGAFMAVGVSIDGGIVASSFDAVLAEDGAVTVVDLPDDPFVYDIDW